MGRLITRTSIVGGVPVNTVAPAITGTPTEGQTLTLSNGSWTNSPSSYAYRWFNNGTPIGGATASTYLLVSGDVGDTITGGVIATNGSGSSSEAVSSGVGPISPAGSFAISGISGSFSQGGTMTISGSGFTTNRSGQVLYENFDAQTTGQKFTHTDLSYNDDYYTSTDTPFSGAKCARADWEYIQPGGAVFDLPDLTEVYVDYRCRIAFPDIGSAGNQQIKMGRLVGGHDDVHTKSPTILPIWQMGNTPLSTGDQVGVYVGGDGNIPNNYYSPEVPEIGTWERYQIWGVIGTINVANGRRCYMGSHNTPSGYRFNTSSNEFRDTANVINRHEVDSEPVTMHATGDSYNSFGQLFLPFYQQTSMHSIVDVDCVFINDSRERVEFGDNADYYSCTSRKMVIQPMQSRASGSIVITAEVGNLTSPVYAYVINSDGARTAAFQVL